jgi:hypothetical protein
VELNWYTGRLINMKKDRPNRSVLYSNPVFADEALLKVFFWNDPHPVSRPIFGLDIVVPDKPLVDYFVAGQPSSAALNVCTGIVVKLYPDLGRYQLFRNKTKTSPFGVRRIVYIP